MNKTRKGLIQFCHEKLGTPYVFGMKGQVLTEEAVNQLARRYPAVFTERYINHAKSYLNRQCTDCSGLISWYTGVLQGSDQYKRTAVETKFIKELNENMAGWALWKPGHIGIYVGDGKCIEAKNILCGTVKTNVSATAWTHVLRLNGIDDSDGDKTEAPGQADHPTGWIKEDGGVRFYLASDRYITNAWYQDESQWFWFDGAGHAIRNDWYSYKDNWYYFGENFAMVKGIQIVHHIPYCFGEDGALTKTNISLMMQTGPDGVLRTHAEIQKSGSPALDAFQKKECAIPKTPKPAKPRTISSKGMALVKEFEGCYLTAYRCPAGVPTIGYGHTRNVAMGTVITQKQAEAFLRKDLEEFEAVVSRLVTVTISQNQFDALVSFSFNVGAGALKNSTLLKKLNAGRMAEAADEFLKWNIAGGKELTGLTRRRKKERALFLSGSDV